MNYINMIHMIALDILGIGVLTLLAINKEFHHTPIANIVTMSMENM